MKQHYTIVLGSHKEDLTWLKYLPKRRKYSLVVSNSNGNILGACDESYTRDNFGREAGHYLHYIITHYDQLDDVTVFLQGDPWPHAAMCGMPGILLELFFGSPSFKHPINYLGRDYTPQKFLMREGSEHHNVLSRALGHSNIGDNIGFSVGAQFCVKRDVILARPVDFYSRLLDIAKDQSLYHADPYYTLAHTLEGCWGSVFKHNES